MKSLVSLLAIAVFAATPCGVLSETITVDDPWYNIGTTVDLKEEGTFEGSLLENGMTRFEGYIQVDRDHTYAIEQKQYRGVYYIGERAEGGKNMPIGDGYWKVFGALGRKVIIVGKVIDTKIGRCVLVQQITFLEPHKWPGKE